MCRTQPCRKDTSGCASDASALGYSGFSDSLVISALSVVIFDPLVPLYRQ